MPTFDPNVDTEGSGNGHDDDDYDNGDDFGGEDDEDDEDKDDYDDADRTIDGPATRTDDDVKPEDEIPTHQPDLNEDYKDTIDLDEDPKKEDEVTHVGGAAGGAVDVVSTRTEFDPIFGRGNDGSSNPERERQWFLFLHFYFLPFNVFFIYYLWFFICLFLSHLLPYPVLSFLHHPLCYWSPATALENQIAYPQCSSWLYLYIAWSTVPWPLFEQYELVLLLFISGINICFCTLAICYLICCLFCFASVMYYVALLPTHAP